jgi:hypothetical protein
MFGMRTRGGVDFLGLWNMTLFSSYFLPILIAEKVRSKQSGIEVLAARASSNAEPFAVRRCLQGNDERQEGKHNIAIGYWANRILYEHELQTMRSIANIAYK